MLIDETQATFLGGKGGPGIVSFGPKHKSGPDGGNGGAGGDLWLESSSDLTLLNQFSAQDKFQGEDGRPGNKQRKTGKDGDDITVYLPVGTAILDSVTGKQILSLEKKGERVLFCKGGKGGKGNWEFRSPRRTTPEYAQPGLPGEKKEVKLILKLIAHFGLIGLPNAGKTSLLNTLTNAKAKIANYAFTTLSPNLGVFNNKIIADIPGLIEGASTGRGLGISFLKHIEKVNLLLHCISADSEDALKDYQTIRKELESYSKKLTKKKEIILITKSDLVDPEKLEEIKTQFPDQNLITVSIYDEDSINSLEEKLS
jgi:GTPase